MAETERKTSFDYETIRREIVKLLREAMPRRAEATLANLSHAIMVITKTGEAKDVESANVRLRSEADRAARYRCSKCGGQMLLADTTCRVCENRALLGHIGTLRTVMQLAHGALIQTLVETVDGVRETGTDRGIISEAARKLSIAAWKAYYLIESALDVPVPAVGTVKRNEWDLVRSVLGLGTGWMAYTVANAVARSAAGEKK